TPEDSQASASSSLIVRPLVAMSTSPAQNRSMPAPLLERSTSTSTSDPPAVKASPAASTTGPRVADPATDIASLPPLGAGVDCATVAPGDMAHMRRRTRISFDPFALPIWDWRLTLSPGYRQRRMTLPPVNVAHMATRIHGPSRRTADCVTGGTRTQEDHAARRGTSHRMKYGFPGGDVFTVPPAVGKSRPVNEARQVEVQLVPFLRQSIPNRTTIVRPYRGDNISQSGRIDCHATAAGH